jgi:hypothetical protein
MKSTITRTGNAAGLLAEETKDITIEALKASSSIATAAFKTSMGWFLPVFLGIAAAGTAGFLVLLLYGAFIYLNSKHEDREKLNKTRRRHK